MPPAASLDIPVPSVNLLARARQQADGGQLDEALATCQMHLSQSSPSADAFSLLGVIHQARRESDEAVRCFQRALYLEPAHRDALTHLMLLCQEQGDYAQAERLRRRLDRPVSGGEA
jgi:chemotaxis protein methyltransferase WspC